MGSTKQKEKIKENPDDDVYIILVWKSRNQELADRMSQREFPGSDDIVPMLEKIGGTLIKSEEYLQTTSVNDKQTLSRQELDQQRESRNRAQNRYWTWQ
ncbi:MAG: hypothetical protein ACJ71P_10385 [Nitrososphaeraceae archaeon]